MKSKIYFKKLITYGLILTTLISSPIYAADSKDKKVIKIEYDKIEDLVKKENLQIKLNDMKLDDMEDALDAADDAENGVRQIQRAIYEMQSMLDDISRTTLDPSVAALAEATKLSLDLNSMSLDTQMGGSGSDNQVEMAELGFKQAELNLVNSTQNMFILYHQLSENISMLERNRELLIAQYEISKISLEYGMIAPSRITDLETSIQEFDANYTSLVHQMDALVLQFKALIGLAYDDNIELGDIPNLDKKYIEEMNFEKDLKDVLKNSLSIKTKKSEVKGANSKTKTYELKIKENDVTLAFTNQYKLIKEKLDSLLLSEKILQSSLAKLDKEILRYEMGMISLMDYNSVVNEVESQKSTVKLNTSSLLMEIEKYEAMKNGMI